MSHEIIYKGNDVDIEKTFDGLVLYGLNDGRIQKILLNSHADLDVMYTIIGEIINKDYAASQITGPVDYDLEGC